MKDDLADGIDYAAGEMTVADLVDRYMNLKRGLDVYKRQRRGSIFGRRSHSRHGIF